MRCRSPRREDLDGRRARDWDKAQVHVLSHALHYGSGVFEAPAYETSRGPAVWHLDEHLRRLGRSAKLYHMDLPYSHDALVEATKDVIRANGLKSCYIRPLAFRGYGEILRTISTAMAVAPATRFPA